MGWRCGWSCLAAGIGPEPRAVCEARVIPSPSLGTNSEQGSEDQPVFSRGLMRLKLGNRREEECSQTSSKNGLGLQLVSNSGSHSGTHSVTPLYQSAAERCPERLCAIALHCSRGRSGASTSAEQKIKHCQTTQLHPKDSTHCQKSLKSPLYFSW